MAFLEDRVQRENCHGGAVAWCSKLRVRFKALCALVDLDALGRGEDFLQRATPRYATNLFDIFCVLFRTLGQQRNARAAP